MAIDAYRVLEALKAVQDPDLHRDIVSLGFVKDVKVDGGRVTFTIELTTPACPVKEQMKAQAEHVVKAIDGVTAVDITMTAQVRKSVAPDLNKASVPGVKNVIAVGAGKGGVGKTTVSVNLAIALAKSGSRVGIIDGDIYGPNVPIMLGVKSQLITDGEKIVPAVKYDIQMVSMGFLATDDAPVIWRGPMLHGVIKQFFHEVRWDNLDYLVIDLPPGTGDVVLSLSQTVHVAGAIVVTTPQQVSLADTRRAVAMYQKLEIPVLGLIENMSHYVCPQCRHEADIFGSGGGERLAGEMTVPFLGRIPISEPLRVGGDTGTPIMLSDPASPASQAFLSAAEQTAAQVSIQSYQKPVIPLKQIN